MRKQLVHKCIAIFFALYLPAASIGLPLHKHYCQGKLKEVQVFFEPESCHEKDSCTLGSDCCSSTITGCHTENQDQDLAKDDCCDNELELIRVDLTLITDSSQGLKFRNMDVLVHIRQELNRTNIQWKNIDRSSLRLTISPFPDLSTRLSFLNQFLC